MDPADETVQFTFEHAVGLYTLDDDPVEVDATELVVDRDVELIGTVPLDTWERVFEAGAFHLDDEPAPAGFEPDVPVLLRLRLRSTIAARYDDAEELLRSFLADEQSPLRATEAWYAVEVTQRLTVPGQVDGWVDIGIRTRAAGN